MKVIPAQPHFKMPDGTIGFPESVLLRMFSSQGAPNVKIVATEDGAEASFVGQEGNVVVKARTRAAPYVTTFAKDGREKVLKP